MEACCKLNESPQTHSFSKRSRGISYLIRIASRKACFSRKNHFSLLVSLLNKMLQLIFTLFYIMFYSLLLAFLHLSAFSIDFWCHFLFLRLIHDNLEIEFRYALPYWLFPWLFLENFYILSEKFRMEWLILFYSTLLVMKIGRGKKWLVDFNAGILGLRPDIDTAV